MSSPPAKWKKHVDSKYQAEWSRFKMASSKNGPLFAFCTVCNSDIIIAGGGVYDVKRHCDGVKHKKSLQYVSAQPSTSSLMNSASKYSASKYSASKYSEKPLPSLPVRWYLLLRRTLWQPAELRLFPSFLTVEMITS